MLVENFILDKIFDNGETREGFSDNTSIVKRIFVFFIELFVMIVAGYLAWTCNSSNSSQLLKFLYTILAVVFSGIYILFYVIYHNIMNVPCM